MVIALAGLLAGILSMVAGFGGGLVFVLALAAWMDPGRALTIAAGALLIGNGHRLFVLRRSLDRRTLAALAMGIVPATTLFAAYVSLLPTELLRIMLVATAAIALIAKLAFRRAPQISPLGFGVAGIGVGAFGATGGGAGFFAGPLLLAAGLRADAYVATMAGVGVCLNVSRSLGYSNGGWLDADAFTGMAIGAIAMVIGNLIGRRLIGLMGERWRRRCIYAVPVAGIALSIATLLG